MCVAVMVGDATLSVVTGLAEPSLDGTAPAITVPSRPFTVTSVPSCSVRVAVRVPTTQGTPSSRETIAACDVMPPASVTVSYTHLRAHETGRNLVCRLLLE